MNDPHPPQASRGALQIRLALSLLLFLVGATLPYLWLIEHFGYDDILREPTAVILHRFEAGGAPLVLAWFVFAMSALLFIPVARGFQHLMAVHGESDPGVSMLGVASAIAQAVGLLRWVLVVPALAASFTDPDSSTATREATAVVFDAVHRFGGMVVGEMVGQLLLAAWTGLVSLQLWRTRAVPRPWSVVGLLIVPLWLLGQSELLHPVVPVVPAIEVVPLAFMAWEAWLLAIAFSLVRSAWRSRPAVNRRGATADPS